MRLLNNNINYKFKHFLFGQLISLFVTIYFIFTHVNGHPKNEQPDKMGVIAAISQIISLFSGVYDIVIFRIFFFYFYINIFEFKIKSFNIYL